MGTEERTAARPHPRIGQIRSPLGIGVVLCLCFAFHTFHLPLCTSTPEYAKHDQRSYQVFDNNFSTARNPRDLRCVVVLVADANYADIALESAVAFRTKGAWTGDIVIVLDDLLLVTTARSVNITIIENHQNYHNGTNDVVEIFQQKIEKEMENAGFGELPIRVVGASRLVDKVPPVRTYNKDGCIRKRRIRAWRGYFLKMTIFTQYFRDRWDRVLYTDSCMTIHLPKINFFFERIDSTGKMLANPDPWIWAKLTFRAQFLGEVCDPPLYAELQADDRWDLNGYYFNSAVMLFDTSIILKHTFRDIAELYYKYGSIANGDQAILSLYWYWIRHDEYDVIPQRSKDAAPNLIPYDFYPLMRDGQYVITSGNMNRPICKKRGSNNWKNWYR